MRLLFDTNVIISAFISRGHAFDVIKDAAARHEIYYTEYIINEIEKSLSKKFKISSETINRATYTITKHFIKGEAATTVENISRDPNDNQVLADALANKIEIIITGDEDLLTLKNYKGIKIIPPRNYWNLD